MKKRLKAFLFSLSLLAIAIILTLALTNLAVVRSSKDRIITYSDASELDDVDYIVVLGCGLKSDGTPSDMLADRISVGVDLHFLTHAPLLASGDHSREDYDEVGAITASAVQSGVEAEMITLDHAGFSTYESMYRAKEIFSSKKVIIVTQRYHLYRAIYIARELGIDAYGISADLRAYRGQGYREVRELLARTKDFFTSLIKPQPTYMGEGVPYVELGE